MSETVDLWVDKYAPRTMDDYVWTGDELRSRVEAWVQAGTTDNLLLAGPAGVGKTSLALMLMRVMDVGPADLLKLNGSKETSVEVVRTKIQGFIEVGGWNGMRYVFIDEFERMSVAAQESLKGEMEQYSSSVRWILTTNAVHRIVNPIRDRCTVIEIEKPDLDTFTDRMVKILRSESVEIDSEESVEALDSIISATYPSLRKCIRVLQNASITGKLISPRVQGGEWAPAALDLMRKKRFGEARKLVCASVTRDEVDDVFRLMYKNSEMFGASEDEAIIIIADHLAKSQNSADHEINLSACMAKLARL